MMPPLRLTGADILRPDVVSNGDIVIADGLIAETGAEVSATVKPNRAALRNLFCAIVTCLCATRVRVLLPKFDGTLQRLSLFCKNQYVVERSECGDTATGARLKSKTGRSFRSGP